MNKNGIRKVAVVLILCALSLGMLSNMVWADDSDGTSEVVDHRIDEPSDASPGENQVVPYRIDTISDDSPGMSQVLPHRIDTLW